MDIMQLMDQLERYTHKLPPQMVAYGIKLVKTIPMVKERIEKEYEKVMADLESKIKPYKGKSTTYAVLPQQGLGKTKIIQEMEALKSQEEAKWQEGYASGAVYHGDNKHIDFLSRVYKLHSQVNPLHPDIWPSALKYESEIVAMTADMLQGPKAQATGDEVCGVVTSGGTESILLAMKTYRDWARAKKGISRPEMITPVTAHAAFEKAAQYFQIKQKRIPLDKDYRVSVPAVRRALSHNTIVIVGSAPTFPHGMVDPIDELSEIAKKRGIGFHSDACLGGFVLPWAEKLGYAVPAFDFRLPGVTSISVDTHKYGYAAKGTSVILYRNPSLRQHQFYKTTDWPGGLYFSPTLAGSRPGALSAACWAAMLAMGQKGYLEATRKILQTAEYIKQEIAKIDELTILGDPLWNIAFAANTLDIYQIMDFMTTRNWSLNGLHKPTCMHICLTLRHTQPGVKERFIQDLNQAIEHVRKNPNAADGMAPIYGLAATVPDRSLVGDMLQMYMDLLYRV